MHYPEEMMDGRARFVRVEGLCIVSLQCFDEEWWGSIGPAYVSMCLGIGVNERMVW